VRAKILTGHVYHSRKDCIKNSFRYPIFNIFFNCSNEQELSKYFRTHFLGLLSFKSRDFLHRKDGDLLENIKDFLRVQCNYQADEVWLQTMPRMFGFAFNPVSFWFCYKNKQVDAVLVEVNNTFGERHFYWISPENLQKDEWIRAKKVFHVSPFLPVEGSYRFRFKVNEKFSRVDIFHYDQEEQLKLCTWIEGDFLSIKKFPVFTMLLRYGWMTPLVVFRIHYQAFKLWMKKAKFYSKPLPPKKEVSL
jgi:uncharacterized protein